jgi:hypothetical protein
VYDHIEVKIHVQPTCFIDQLIRLWICLVRLSRVVFRTESEPTNRLTIINDSFIHSFTKPREKWMNEQRTALFESQELRIQYIAYGIHFSFLFSSK